LLQQIKTTEPSRVILRASGALLSELDWRLAASAALKDGTADRVLLMQVLGELLHSLATAVSGAALEINLGRREQEACFTLAWQLPQPRLLRQCDVPVPFRSAHRMLGLHVQVLSEDGVRRTCFAPYQDWTPDTEMEPTPAKNARVVLKCAFDI
jgi:hypothetical protein